MVPVWLLLIHPNNHIFFKEIALKVGHFVLTNKKMSGSLPSTNYLFPLAVLGWRIFYCQTGCYNSEQSVCIYFLSNLSRLLDFMFLHLLV